MQSKSTFFTSSHYEVSSIDNFDSIFRKLVLSAYKKRYSSVADARLYLTICGIDLESTVKILLAMEKNGLLNTSIANSIFTPVGCGDVANTFCKMMTGDEMISSGKETYSLEYLGEELEKDLPKIVRIDIPGHSYVMLACEKTSVGVLGYIYQSNVAYGMEDNSFSLAAWMMDSKSCKTNLSIHLQKLALLMHPAVPSMDKANIYLELYSAKPIVEVKIPANMQEIVSYIDENIFLRYKIKTLCAKDMLLIADRIKNMTMQNPAELQQSLDTYITKMEEEQEDLVELEYQPATKPVQQS
ncbi:hypothetical protein [Legionella parisiensis]|uniref:Uncharacterized protein n=1 Tax=Legionella parisiensis TaxID=45071 RepID=A0A1E5JWH9_9GAMM|nr:hypothetical protein [Legionella parisiensis]KTD40496.1 hypothetical protein Lpar_1813 [Legionella parisiensis]OEH48448.1 hypothetical protein lpari_00523 [Legionella parisiensis]STX77069.1 Uncharacterised protein [Legionella parisiensis]